MGKNNDNFGVNDHKFLLSSQKGNLVSRYQTARQYMRDLQYPVEKACRTAGISEKAFSAMYKEEQT